MFGELNVGAQVNFSKRHLSTHLLKSNILTDALYLIKTKLEFVFFLLWLVSALYLKSL